MRAAGSDPEIPDHLQPGRNKQLAPDGKSYLPPFKNICPACTTFKATQRPTSAGRVRQQGDFRIRKQNTGVSKRDSITKKISNTRSNVTYTTSSQNMLVSPISG